MRVFLIIVLASCPVAIAQEEPAKDQPRPDKLIQRAAARLIEIQEEDGAWPYEGVYRVRRRIPVGYRVGGTAIVSTSLLYSGQDIPDDYWSGDRPAVVRRKSFVLFRVIPPR